MAELKFWQELLKRAVKKYGMRSDETRYAFRRCKEVCVKVWQRSE